MPKSPKSKRGNKANEEAMLARADAVLARLSQPIEPAKKDETHKPASVVNNTLNRVYDNFTAPSSQASDAPSGEEEGEASGGKRSASPAGEKSAVTDRCD